jgi:hypothetical protein
MACGKSWYRNYGGNSGGKFNSRCPSYQRGYSIFTDDLAAGIWGFIIKVFISIKNQAIEENQVSSCALYTAFSGVMSYVSSGQDARTTRVS